MSVRKYNEDSATRKERLRNYYRNRDQKNPDIAKNKKLKHLYGITLEFYNALLVAQHNVCAICHQPNYANRALVVDHCHTTKVVRGLLCGLCNTAIGALKDNPELTRSATDYLERYRATLVRT